MEWNKARDIILFFAGLAGIGYETVISASPSETLVIAFMGMMGLPIFLRADERKNGTDK